MSKHFSQFPNGNPPQNTDRFLFGRVDGTSPTGFRNYHLTWAQIVAAIGGITPSTDRLLMGDDSLILMGDDSAILVN